MAAPWHRLLALAQEEVRATIAELPPELRERAEPLPVVFERVPPPDMLDEVVQPDTLTTDLPEVLVQVIPVTATESPTTCPVLQRKR